MIRLSLDEGAALYEDDIRELVKPFFQEEGFEIHTPEGVHTAERAREASPQSVSGRRGVEIGQMPYISIRAGGLPLSGDRKRDKGLVKRALYEALSSYTGRTLPWGALTGIRPVTLASPLVEAALAREASPTRAGAEAGFAVEGSSAEGSAVASSAAPGDAVAKDPAASAVPAAANVAAPPVAGAVSQGGERELSQESLLDIRRRMREEYLLSEEKLDLLLDIALREQRLLGDLKRRSGVGYREGWSLYVGIPFCPTRCLYCSFTSEPVGKWRDQLPEYLTALRREIRFCMQELCEKQGKVLQTLYVGGGTPTALPEEALRQLLDLVQEECFRHPGAKICEFTVEAGRPDSVSQEKLRLLREAGVGRISINPQSFVNQTLVRIGRRHSAEAVEEAYAMARESGFSNINMDLILGLPGEGIRDVAYTLERVVALRPESLTVHSLAVKRAARLQTEREEWQDVQRAGDREMEEMMQAAADTAASLSLRPYYLYRQKNMAGNLENVGYSLEDKACLYNVLMMSSRHTVLGCGAGSASKIVLYQDHCQDQDRDQARKRGQNQDRGQDRDQDGKRGRDRDQEQEPGQVRILRCDNGKDIRNYMGHLDDMLLRKRQILASL